jgi:Asp-tRNA(Asn)/Glu-tRNA(Gln) amidotransferase A subunit family amidase
MDKEPFEIGVLEALSLLRAGRLGVEALVRSCLERIDAMEPSVGAFVRFDRDFVLDQARRIGGEDGQGPLWGLPVGIKDIFDTIDLPTEYGSAIYEGFRPRRDATAVATIRRAGGVIAGKTTTTEFAGLAPTPTRNPKHLEHTPGGSSAGSAAAVAAGMVPLAIGTQTGGSIIRPAAYCGIVGFKPSFGSIDRTGVRPAVETLDTIGVFARSVADAAHLFAVLAGERVQLFGGPGEPVVPRIGLCRTLQWNSAAPVIQHSLLDVAEILRQAGADCIDFHVPLIFEGLIEAQRVIMMHGTLLSTLSEYHHQPTLLSRQTMELVQAGLTISPDEVRRAWALFERARVFLSESMETIDILITPSVPDTAPRGLTSTGDAVFNKLWTALGVPAVTLPFGDAANGLPLSVQLIGKRGLDNELLGYARWVEANLTIAARA